jgi:GNAT superfamily N-acetyltransferase
MLACEHVLTTFIGAMNGQPVGFACLRLIPHLQGDEPYAELTDIYVDAPFRRQGVARALIAHLEAAARAAGAGGLVIITGFDNERAGGRSCKRLRQLGARNGEALLERMTNEKQEVVLHFVL